LNAAKKIILLLWLLLVASLGNASALTPGATENRTWEKSLATAETRQAEPTQTAGRHQANGVAGYDYAVDCLLAAEGTAQLPGKLYHYTGEGNVASILENGLGAGGRRTFATPVGNLSPVQAQIELALPANRGYPGALFEIDTARLQQLGINPAVGPQRIMSTPNAGGGGIEFIFNQPIPPSAIRQAPFP
jgi:hypothetical protein